MEEELMVAFAKFEEGGFDHKFFFLSGYFQLGTIYYRSIYSIWIQFGMRLTDTYVQGLFE